MKTVKKTFYWVDGDGYSQKIYFSSKEKFLKFLRENDAVKCGADKMTIKQFNCLPSNIDMI